MTNLIKKLTKQGKNAARKAYENMETRVLVAEGRKAVRGKVRTVAKVSRKAVKTGVVAGALAATMVVVREIRKRRQRI
jgi:Ni,Fe-hydrogenase III small subunit